MFAIGAAGWANDLRLSYGGARRQAAERRLRAKAVGAAVVTRGAVCCGAWSGVEVIRSWSDRIGDGALKSVRSLDNE